MRCHPGLWIALLTLIAILGCGPKTWRQRGTLTGHADKVRGIAINKNGDRGVSVADDRRAYIWDLKSSAALYLLEEHAKEVVSVEWKPDGMQLATGSRDGTAILWDTNSGAAKFRLQVGDSGLAVGGLRYTIKGDSLITGGVGLPVAIWDTAKGEPTGQFIDCMNAKDFLMTPDEKSVVIVGFTSPPALYDLTNRAKRLEYKGSIAAAAAISPDGTLTAAYMPDHTVQTWLTETGLKERTCEGLTNEGHALAFSPDSRYLAAGDMDGTVVVWDVAAGTKVSDLHGQEMDVALVVWSPDGAWLAVGSNDPHATLWDAKTWENIATITHTDAVPFLAFSPDSTTLVTGSYDTTLQVWQYR
ncbi:MAG: WD40 repeat domain-containing protein [bacterium]